MEKMLIEYGFMQTHARQYYDQTGDHHPSTKAMSWCMFATGCHRIFTKEDLKEFLFRLAIVLEKMGITENWLHDQLLFPYKDMNCHYSFTIEDIANHFGIQACDSTENLNEQSNFLQNIKKHITNAIFLSHLQKLYVIPVQKKKPRHYAISAEGYVPEITDELLRKATFFSDDAMRFIPDGIFESRNEDMQIKEAEIAGRIEAIRKLPVFDIGKIPTDVIHQCLRIMFFEKDVLEMIENEKEFNIRAKPMIYLAWLYANDMINVYPLDAWPVEGVYLNEDDYTLEEGGFNFLTTIEDYNMKEMVPLLKGVGV